MPKVSVLMPVYNTKEEYLREAIESVLNQTFSDFEFLIINDGSTDESVERIILSYKDKRIKYFKQENQGIAKSLNRGIHSATGEYIARMDADDISVLTRFEKQVRFLDNNIDISICGGWHQAFPQNIIYKVPATFKYFDLFCLNRISHPTIMFRKNDFIRYKLEYDPKYKSEDYELWTRAIKCLNFYNLQEVLLKYRCEGQNISSEKNVFLDSDEKIRISMLNFLTDDVELQEKIRNLIYKHIQKFNKCSFIEKIFSIRSLPDRTRKIIRIFGIKIIIKRGNL